MKGKIINSVSRRNLFKFGATAVGSGLITSKLGLNLFDAPAADAKQRLTPDLAVAELLQGNKRFSSQKINQPNRGSFRLREVASGQKPFAAILGCADSRVPAEIVFDQGLGDLFVVRVAGNVATPEEIGSLEYGTLVLGAKVILVLGHQKCGAVKAAMDNQPVPGQIGSVLKHIKTLKVASTNESGDLLRATTIANIKNQIATLKASPVVTDLINSGKLKIIGGFYSLDTGIVTQVA
ncbi:carbonic anhydrase [Chamaesiphon minutus]|uniref:carbonic anhydrase n=1 Tax=Chamaesiphon minutus (strain ATCC 27169 / PCC 6605) TaxID=1173020 RepID=K9UA96_CHAP6|nr:carbonic anhydrase [Chamaesiphon minutus]AFY91750.1 carbonic anhydrase [Chamaesiphon minutus PCC 6605]